RRGWGGRAPGPEGRGGRCAPSPGPGKALAGGPPGEEGPPRPGRGRPPRQNTPRRRPPHKQRYARPAPPPTRHRRAPLARRAVTAGSIIGQVATSILLPERQGVLNPMSTGEADLTPRDRAAP